MLTGFASLTIGLIALRCGSQIYLDAINRRTALAHAARVPEPFVDTMDAATYAKSVQYTLAKSRLNRFELCYDSGLLLLILFSGLLPWSYALTARVLGDSVWSMAAWLWGIGALLALPGLPLEWYAQFRLEERFGFNTSTLRTWCIDRLKALLLAAALGYTLLLLVLKIMQWTGPRWWLWAWATLMAFQLLMLVLAPLIILPLFNKFTPLPEGSLRARLLHLAERTGFRARDIQVMDGSKRSRHSNAFFTGFGGFRRIVLFDTLIAQLTEAELEAVLAHEIGHDKGHHVVRMVAVSALLSLAAFWALSLLAAQPWLYSAFGFGAGRLVPALLLFALLHGLATFWLSPILNHWSRRFEYQADRFAASVLPEADSLINALRKLHAKNLSNLTPHPLYSAFYYSHPTLLERERALRETAPG